QAVPVHSQEPRREALPTPGEPQRAQDVVALDLPERLEALPLRRLELRREVTGLDLRKDAEGVRPLERVPELTHVPRVGMPEEELERLRRERLPPPARPGQLVEERLREGGDVLEPLPERGDADLDD